PDIVINNIALSWVVWSDKPQLRMKGFSEIFRKTTLLCNYEDMIDYVSDEAIISSSSKFPKKLSESGSVSVIISIDRMMEALFARHESVGNKWIFALHMFLL